MISVQNARLFITRGILEAAPPMRLGSAFQFDRKKQKLKDFIPSRLFLYYNERVDDKNMNSDSGAHIRNGIKSLNVNGVCPETEWPYNVEEKFTEKPPKKCYHDALKCTIKSYQQLNEYKFNANYNLAFRKAFHLFLALLYMKVSKLKRLLKPACNADARSKRKGVRRPCSDGSRLR